MAPGGGDPSNLGHLPQSYINAVTKPNADTYAAEIPNASWIKVFLGIAVVAVISTIASFVAAGATAASMEQLEDQLAGTGIDPAIFGAATTTGGPVGSFIAPFITFFLGAGLLFLLSRLYGGTGGSFLTHSYLLSLSYTPLRVVAALLSFLAIVPAIACIVAPITLVLAIYQLFCAGRAMQAAHRMEAGRAQLAAFTGLVIVLILGCIAVFACGAMLAGILGAAGNQ